jgi:type 1 glutamine amidotransferase
MFMFAGIPSAATAVCLLAAGLSQGVARTGASPQSRDAALRVLILSGSGNHGWRASAPFLRHLLEDTGRFKVWVSESPAGLTAPMVADFDVLVDDGGGGGAGSDAEKVIAAFVESGNGLVITHGALGAYAGRHGVAVSQPATKSAAELTPPAYWPVLTAGSSASPVHFFEMKMARPEHAITGPLQGRFRIADAPYRDLAARPGTEVLAVGLDAARADGGGKDEPLLIAGGYGKGRIFCIGLGHDLAAMQAREFITTLARGTEWAATGAVTLPADLRLRQPHADPVRGLLITGGHDHDTCFYSLFDGYKDLARMPVTSSAAAFQSDLRDKYDVLVLYDFSRDLSETGKKNLHLFVESGKGIVVLHHALLDYQDWLWWYEEVVGGSYRLRKQGGRPSSTYKGDQQIFVSPEGQHPVTAGLGPFQVMDETYKQMWISPRVRPLLTTDNPTSDRLLAWIGPCATSRVVAIQLGHGPTIFSHPAYRTLVHSAILWSAGRLR